MTVDVSKVQTGVLQRFESWHKEMEKAFARVLQAHMQRLLSHLKDAREQLETFSGDEGTSDAVDLLNRMQALKRSKAEWQGMLQLLQQGERTLHKHRFKFPKEWTYVEMVDGEWMALIKVRATASACAAPDTPLATAQLRRRARQARRDRVEESGKREAGRG